MLILRKFRVVERSCKKIIKSIQAFIMQCRPFVYANAKTSQLFTVSSNTPPDVNIKFKSLLSARMVNNIENRQLIHCISAIHNLSGFLPYRKFEILLNILVHNSIVPIPTTTTSRTIKN